MATNAPWLNCGAVWADQCLVGHCLEGTTDHINVLELRDVLLALRAWTTDIWGQVVLIQCDNQLAVACILPKIHHLPKKKKKQ